jgi:hypothetical protein
MRSSPLAEFEEMYVWLMSVPAPRATMTGANGIASRRMWARSSGHSLSICENNEELVNAPSSKCFMRAWLVVGAGSGGAMSSSRQV